MSLGASSPSPNLTRYSPVLRWAAAAIAAKRLTDLIVDDEIARPARDLIEARGGEWGEYVVACHRCVSVWAGFAVVLAPAPLVNALAVSEAVINLIDLEDRFS